MKTWIAIFVATAVFTVAWINAFAAEETSCSGLNSEGYVLTSVEDDGSFRCDLPEEGR